MKIPCIPRVQGAVWHLSFAFCVLFFAAGTIQQFATPWFRQLGKPAVGYNALLLVYLSYAAGSLVSAGAVSRLGEKRGMLAASIVYACFCFGMGSGSMVAAYAGAVLAGLAAAVLWASQTIYLNRVGTMADVTTGAGVFYALYPLGSGIGSVVFGLLAGHCGYRTTMLAFAGVGLVAIGLFARLKDLSQNSGNQLGSRWVAPARGATCLKCVAIVFAQRGVYGLIISRVPLEVKSLLGPEMVGVLCAPFFVLPFFLSTTAAALIRRHGHFRIAVLGCCVSAAAPLLFRLPQSGLSLAAAILAATLGAIILNPLVASLPSYVAEPKHKGRVSGLLTM